MATAARERADLQVATARKEAATSVIEAQEQAANSERVAAELAIKVAELAAKDIEMTTKDIEIAAKDAELAAKDAELAAKDAELAAKDAELAAKNAELTAAELVAAESQAVLAQALAMLTNNQKTLSKPAEKELDATNITSDEHTLATTSDDGKDYLATADGELSVTEPAKGSGRKTRRGCRGKRLSKRQNNALASEEAGGPSGNGDGGS
ncbi:hypothetical protein FBU59_002377 [Linderina macrospora]|uniref:Uncharacterized protein n=1 Tax=Linderina macrospora TaxID=4868 RepID=A0ACC1JBK5_9FUNG|nr:hypothetical protein FBU59_002377 [Linderina macrospora]